MRPIVGLGAIVRVVVAPGVTVLVRVGVGVGDAVGVLVGVSVGVLAAVAAKAGVAVPNPVVDAAAGRTPPSETRPINTISALRRNRKDRKVISKA